MSLQPASIASRQPGDLQNLLSLPAPKLARGTPQGAGRRIVLKLDIGTFDRVALLAAASGVSFAEAVRQLVVRGLLSNARADNARRRHAANGEERP